MEKREKPWNRVFHIVEKENCVYNKSLWIFVKEKNVRIWIGYRKRHIREQRNKEWSRAMVRWSADDIIYEDEQILVCRKHSGMAVQSARVGQMDLESELRNYRNGNYIGIVQRLDQPVEGVLVFGKTPQATAWLNKQHQKRVSGCFYRHTSKRKAGYLGGLSYKRRKNQYFTGDG